MTREIDPDNFLDEFGNVRRRDNVVAELVEGDLLIGYDGELYQIKDGDLTIYASGIKSGDGIPMLIPRDQATNGFAIGVTANIFNMNELGLNRDEDLSQ